MSDEGAEGQLHEGLVGLLAHVAVLLPPAVVPHGDGADVVRDAVVHNVAGNLVENVPDLVVARPAEVPDAPGRAPPVCLPSRGLETGELLIEVEVHRLGSPALGYEGPLARVAGNSCEVANADVHADGPPLVQVQVLGRALENYLDDVSLPPGGARAPGAVVPNFPVP